MVDEAVVNDEGYGITVRSLKRWKSNKAILLKRGIRRIVVSSRDLGTADGVDMPGYTMMIQANGLVLLLSGCNCGYGGEGPHGTLKILEDIGVDIDIGQPLMPLIAGYDRLVFVAGKQWVLESATREG